MAPTLTNRERYAASGHHPEPVHIGNHPLCAHHQLRTETCLEENPFSPPPARRCSPPSSSPHRSKPPLSVGTPMASLPPTAARAYGIPPRPSGRRTAPPTLRGTMRRPTRPPSALPPASSLSAPRLPPP